MTARQFARASTMVRERLPRRRAVARLAGGVAAGLLASAGSLGLNGRRMLAQAATPPAGSPGYMVVRRYQLLPGESMDEVVAIVQDGFVPIITTIPGFKDYQLVDAGNGAHLTISLFDSPAGAEASTAAAADWAAENVAHRLEGPAEVSEGWVRLQVSSSEVAETV